MYQSSDRTVQHLCLHLLYAEQSFAGSKTAKETMTGRQQETRNQYCCYCLGKSFRCFAIFVILPFCVLNTPHQEGQDRMGFGCAEMQGEYKTSFASSFSDFLDCSTFCSTASWPVCECILVHSKVNLFFIFPFYEWLSTGLACLRWLPYI